MGLLDCNIKENNVLVILDHSPVCRVTVPYAACVQLYPPEDEHLILKHVEETNILRINNNQCTKVGN